MKINKLKILIMFVFALCSLCNSYAQELRGLKMFLGFTQYNNEAEKFKNYLPNLQYVINKIEYKIPELESAYNKSIIGDGFCSLWLSFNYFQNFEIQNDVIYYGGIELVVYRDFIDKKTDLTITPKVFYELYYITMVNPTVDMIKQDSYNVTNELIDKLALEYYKDN